MFEDFITPDARDERKLTEEVAAEIARLAEALETLVYHYHIDVVVQDDDDLAEIKFFPLGDDTSPSIAVMRVFRDGS